MLMALKALSKTVPAKEALEFRQTLMQKNDNIQRFEVLGVSIDLTAKPAGMFAIT